MNRIILTLAIISLGAGAEETNPKKSASGASAELAATKVDVLERLVNNAKAIKSALDMFAFDFDGSYPSDEAGDFLEKEMRKSGKFSKEEIDAGYFLRQLNCAYALGGTQTHFYYSALDGQTKGAPLKDRFVLAEECRLTYVKDLRQISNTDTPILLTPMIPGTLKFDSKVFGGKAVVVCVGNAIKVFDIGPEGELIGDGEKFFEHGKSVWENEPVTPERFQYAPAEKIELQPKK